MESTHFMQNKFSIVNILIHCWHSTIFYHTLKLCLKWWYNFLYSKKRVCLLIYYRCCSKPLSLSLPSDSVTKKINFLGNGSSGKVLIYFKPQAIWKITDIPRVYRAKNETRTVLKIPFCALLAKTVENTTVHICYKA